MNYRHAFHAGNFADVFKHAVLARILLYLGNKEAPFRVIDTHAGAGRYDLAGSAAARTNEWKDGIGRLLADPPEGETGELLAPYLSVVQSDPGHYPGSPLIALRLTRPQDRLVFCELHPEEYAALTVAVGHERRASIVEADGWTALKAALPPPERRGLVVIDPPFEDGGDFRRFEEGLQEGNRRWPSGTYFFWYPIKDAHEVERFVKRIARLGIPKILRAELTVGDLAMERLASCGLLLVNPPWTLERELETILPALVRLLGNDGSARYRLDRLTV
ncbi:MAG TPA: 23S rRNA (adenine(2030)-N(6))-methyltransferase RlmJ [Xanthobacteraceae bacterium]|nr:23S rRNA (adenine(2030)-N(6))-methyltransferase RlmJ [Xanthobacteraceae bacterium]